MTSSVRRSATRRIARVQMAVDEYPLAQAARLMARFDLPRPLEAFDFPEKGNINQHTYIVRSGRGGADEYLLQKINQAVFIRPKNVMAAMIECLRAQNEALRMQPLPPGEEWVTIHLIPTLDGRDYLETCEGRREGVWRMMERIPNAITYKSLSELPTVEEQLRVASEAGRGLALFGNLTQGMHLKELENPLPGYRDTRIYFDQLRSVLAHTPDLESARPYLPPDAVVCASVESHFHLHCSHAEHLRRLNDPEVRALLEIAESSLEFGLRLQEDREAGAIRTVAVHGDTKLDNFLFDARTGRAKALVDLDTIMPHTWLSDWGDMVRSLVNVAGEKEPDPGRVQVDMAIYEAIARGFLRTARGLPRAETQRMHDAVRTIALELGVRFLSDYLRGDSYFLVGPADPPDINLIRARVQLTLYQRLTERAEEAEEVLSQCAN